jgi:hypothetical protein
MLLPNSSNSNQQFPNNLFESSLRKQEHSLTSSSSRDDGAFFTSSSTVVLKRQVEDFDLQCENNQRLFRVEVNTDNYPEDTSWELVHVSSGKNLMKVDDFDASLSRQSL